MRVYARPICRRVFGVELAFGVVARLWVAAHLTRVRKYVMVASEVAAVRLSLGRWLLPRH